MRFLSWLLRTAIGVAVAAWLIEGIVFEGPTEWPDEFTEKLVPLLLVSLILGVLTSFVKPILTILSIPFIILTLGLFLVLINAALLKMTSWLADELDIGFTRDHLVVGDRRRHRDHPDDLGRRPRHR